MNRQLLTGAFAIGILTTVATLSAQPAKAIVLNPAGTFTEIQPVFPDTAGVYGVETRGGRAGARDWEIGAGQRTSTPPGNTNFNQSEFNWGNAGTFHDFSLNWTPNTGVNVTIGGVTTTWNDAAWQAGNALKIVTKRNAQLKLTEIDGHVVDYILGTLDDDSFDWIFADASLTDGWNLKGQISVLGGRGSANQVLVKAGNFTPVPTPAAVLPGLMGMGAAVFRKKKQEGEVEQQA